VRLGMKSSSDRHLYKSS